MADPYLGQITMFAGGFAPRGWAFCNGQLLQISQHTALFSILGTIYGGDGRVTFGLPNLQGRLPMHWGHGPGLSTRQIGEWGGSETVTLTSSQLPSHTHTVSAGESTSHSTPDGSVFPGEAVIWTAGTGSPVAMDAAAIGDSGGGQAHTNLQPYTTMQFIIATLGVYPPRE